MTDTVIEPATTEVPAVEDGGADERSDSGTAPAADGLVEDELLVEEISIDGMCGVY